MLILKRLALALLVLIAVIALLIFINPQFAPSHEEPFLALVDEKAGNPPSEDQIVQRVILFGDAGSSSSEPLQASLVKMAERGAISPSKTAMVALGDNIYYFGYPNKEEGQEEWDDDQLESIGYLNAQLSMSSLADARYYFVPGNHDWYAGALEGMREHITRYAIENKVSTEFRPLASDVLASNDAVNLPGVSLVFMDSSALLSTSDEELAVAMDIFRANLKSIRTSYPDNLIVVNQHHPLETMGQHAGYMTHFAYWFFINFLDLFTDVTAEDTTDPNYQRVIAAMNATMAPFDKIMHAAGHDHSLQVFRRPHDHAPEYTIVSGAANTSKLSGVGDTPNTRFALSQEGFVELNVTADGVYLQVFDINHDEARAGFWLSF